MADFSDDFNEVVDTLLKNHIPDVGTAWVWSGGSAGTADGFKISAAIDAITTDLGATGSQGIGYNAISPNIGSADHQVWGKNHGFSSDRHAYMAVRIVDKDNFYGYKLHGTGSSGRRLTRFVGGVGTDLDQSQGVSGEWIKVKAEGDTISIWSGGTGAEPVDPESDTNWTLIHSETLQTNHQSETKCGLVILDTTANTFLTSFRASAIGGSNAAPVLASVEATPIDYTVSSVVDVTDTLTITDSDNADLTGAVVQITGTYDEGEDFLLFTNQSGITGSWSDALGVLTLSGTASVTDYQTALRSIQYANGSNPPKNGTRTITFTVNDGTDDSNTVSRDIEFYKLTADANVTLGGFTTSATASFTGIAKSADGLVSLPALDGSGSGTFEEPTYSGDGVVSVPSIDVDASGLVSDPQYQGSVTVTLAAVTGVSTGSYAAELRSADGSVTLAAVGSTISGQFEPPEYHADGSVQLGSVGATSSGTTTEPSYRADASVDLSGVTVVVSGSTTEPTYRADGLVDLTPITVTSTGSIENPTYSGDATVDLPALGVVGSGQYADAIRSGDATVALASINATSTGTTTIPTYSGEGSVTLASFGATISASFTSPSFEGTITVALPSVTVSASGAYLSESVGEVSVTLPAVSGDGTGTITTPTYSGDAVVELAAFQCIALEVSARPAFYYYYTLLAFYEGS